MANCTATGNGQNGIIVSSQTAIKDCVATWNALDGVLAGSGCRVQDNTCNRNGQGTGGGAGIHVTSNDNRIEGNTATRNVRGIDVDAGGNLVIRNSASGNSADFDIVGGNTVGPIVTSATIASNSNPHANYEF